MASQWRTVYEDSDRLIEQRFGDALDDEGRHIVEERVTHKPATRDAIIRRATDALAANQAYMAKTSPTAAESTAQVKALTRQMNAVIRLTLGRTEEDT